jgi:uncharacterized membrane protein YeaQ/YmgE (transglycosylase-associated protein family)
MVIVFALISRRTLQKGVIDSAQARKLRIVAHAHSISLCSLRHALCYFISSVPAAWEPHRKGETMSFTLLDFVILLIIAGICGALGQIISGTGRGGLFASIALGFIGALFGLWLARLMDLHEPLPLQIGAGGPVFPVVWSIAGAAIFLVLLNLLRAPFSRYRD